MNTITGATIDLGAFPTLSAVAWHIAAGTLVNEDEALALIERNWRHIDQQALTREERDLIDGLVARHGNGVLLV